MQLCRLCVKGFLLACLFVSGNKMYASPTIYPSSGYSLLACIRVASLCLCCNNGKSKLYFFVFLFKFRIIYDNKQVCFLLFSIHTTTTTTGLE